MGGIARGRGGADAQLTFSLKSIKLTGTVTGTSGSYHNLGNTIDYDMELVIPDPSKSLNDGAVDP